MSAAVAPATVRNWWRTLITHRPPGPGQPCPICRVRRCWAWASARGNLVAHGLYHLGPPTDLGPPRTADRPDQPADGKGIRDGES
ncbi:hypothetical protein ABZ671_26360 [Micromonospora sp. NPDC006766]|uniref:hypothetical protein n=1 Tax=Micromonospora sp. NPDC006766 TaxID=3154778 RepID=UPI0033FABCEA